MSRFFYLFTCGLLLAMGWASALAQGTPDPTQRLNLELIDNRSTFLYDNLVNSYVNTLRLNQPTGDYKFTAGLLNQGNNYITLTRIDDSGNTANVARINLNADARDSEPLILVDPESIQLTGDVPATGQFAFGGWSLNEDVTISIDGAGFSVSPTTLSPVNHDIEPQYITVTYNGNQDQASATVTITSEAGTRTVAVTYVKETGGIIGSIDFYNDFAHTDAQIQSVPEPWAMINASTGAAGTVYMQNSGYAYISGSSALTFTMPAGYTNSVVTVVITFGTDVGHPYIVINGGAYGPVQAGYTYYILLDDETFSTGDVISFRGAYENNGNLTYGYSPDIADITIYEGEVNPPSGAPRRGVPPMRVKAPAIAITPSISYWDADNQTWGTETSLAASTIYLPNDLIDLNGLGNITDRFTVSTEGDYPAYYTYQASLDADILIPDGGSGGYDFYAALDFGQCTSADINTAVFVDPDNWTWRYAAVYNGQTSNNTYCGYIVSEGNITYYVPNTFVGNTVAVTVLTGVGSEGAGKLVVNGVLYEYRNPGSTHTWNVPVGANGTVVLEPAPGEDFSVDLSKIEIRGVNNASASAPVRVLTQPVATVSQIATDDTKSSEHKQIKR